MLILLFYRRYTGIHHDCCTHKTHLYTIIGNCYTGKEIERNSIFILDEQHHCMELAVGEYAHGLTVIYIYMVSIICAANLIGGIGLLLEYRLYYMRTSIGSVHVEHPIVIKLCMGLFLLDC